MPIDPDRALEIYLGLSEALRLRPGDSLHDAAKREIGRRGPHIMTAHLVVAVGKSGKRSHEAWTDLERAWRAALGNRWKPVKPPTYTDEGTRTL